MEPKPTIPSSFSHLFRSGVLPSPAPSLPALSSRYPIATTSLTAATATSTATPLRYHHYHPPMNTSNAAIGMQLSVHDTSLQLGTASDATPYTPTPRRRFVEILDDIRRQRTGTAATGMSVVYDFASPRGATFAHATPSSSQTNPPPPPPPSSSKSNYIIASAMTAPQSPSLSSRVATEPTLPVPFENITSECSIISLTNSSRPSSLHSDHKSITASSSNPRDDVPATTMLSTAVDRGGKRSHDLQLPIVTASNSDVATTLSTTTKDDDVVATLFVNHTPPSSPRRKRAKLNEDDGVGDALKKHMKRDELSPQQSTIVTPSSDASIATSIAPTIVEIPSPFTAVVAATTSSPLSCQVVASSDDTTSTTTTTTAVTRSTRSTPTITAASTPSGGVHIVSIHLLPFTLASELPLWNKAWFNDASHYFSDIISQPSVRARTVIALLPFLPVHQQSPTRQAGGITVEQLRSCFVIRRMRSKNAKPNPARDEYQLTWIERIEVAQYRAREHAARLCTAPGCRAHFPEEQSSSSSSITGANNDDNATTAEQQHVDTLFAIVFTEAAIRKLCGMRYLLRHFTDGNLFYVERYTEE